MVLCVVGGGRTQNDIGQEHTLHPILLWSFRPRQSPVDDAARDLNEAAKAVAKKRGKECKEVERVQRERARRVRERLR